MKNKGKIKVGDTIFIEQAWEDVTGRDHDEYATVLAIEPNGRMKLKFRRDNLTEMLADAEFFTKDYEDNIEN